MAIRLLLITGPPGSGKTTLIQRLYDHHNIEGVTVAGMITRESKTGLERAGFKLANLATGEEGWLARRQGAIGPRMGRYNVESRDLERIGTGAILDAIQGDARLVLVDEIGPMEMTSQSFRSALSKLLASDKVVVATVKYDSDYLEVEHARRTLDTRTIRLTHSNRDSISREIIAEVDAMLGLTGEGEQ